MHGGFHTCAKGVPLRSKVAAIITVFLLGVGLLVFIMVQMQNYASIINDAGVVRGATQRAVKLEIADMPNEDVVERVDEVLASLIDREDQRPLKSRETREFEDALFRIEDEWGLIKQEFAEPSPSEERLLALSEEHFRLADTTVFLAQRRAESDFLWIAAVGSLLICGASLFVSLLERHHRLKLRKALVTDPLTGGRNQFSFEEEAQRLVQAAGAGAYLVAYSNVVGFRSVNESFGRMAGDGVIRTLNALFEKACGPDELVGHVNADHFVMLLRNDENRMEQVAAQTAARLRADDALPFSDRIVCGYGTYELADGGEDIATAVSNASVVLKEGTITNLDRPATTMPSGQKLAFERHVEERMRKALAARRVRRLRAAAVLPGRRLARRRRGAVPLGLPRPWALDARPVHPPIRTQRVHRRPRLLHARAGMQALSADGADEARGAAPSTWPSTSRASPCCRTTSWNASSASSGASTSPLPSCTSRSPRARSRRTTRRSSAF